MRTQRAYQKSRKASTIVRVVCTQSYSYLVKIKILFPIDFRLEQAYQESRKASTIAKKLW